MNLNVQQQIDWLALTRAGWDEMRRLQQVGLDRFALFVAD